MTPAAERWRPDILGPRFEQRTLELEPDAEGEVVATLVRYRPPFAARFSDSPVRGADVLYVHGWSDYFFQTELARFWGDRGARFFALDLRKYGRSLRPHQTPGYITDLAAYDEEIGAALAVIAPADGPRRPLILMGHSTGGLTLSLWASRHPDAARAVVLNSPWLEFQAGQLGREALAPLTQWQARHRPRDPYPVVDLGFYTRSVSSAFEGHWHYDLAWRPEHGFPVYPGWLNAVLHGHAQVSAGLGIEAPVLTMLSSRSILRPRWEPAMASADVALDVDVVAQRSLALGQTVTVMRVTDALHDITLSAPEVRLGAYRRLGAWIDGIFAD
ncbi:alpha/beta hydrolase [Herbiconiux daphne]|uniref:Alpha/beta hydrolase n=1 Tax=Herbiconiux daphne TaxID=2970914 RepID=A0ABT2H3R7_9MICO|nr:alpha/beta hydrolase [Herbiconiux daphne]MCS5734572.1 alpha/beta hydrolase [Herbiconiux daphne]